MAKQIVPKEKKVPGKIVPKEKKEQEDLPEKLTSQEESEMEDTDADVVEEDYLRQYQYKKVNNIPTIGGVLTDPEKGSKAERMKKFLLGQKKVAMLIPLPEGSDPKVLHSVTLNGYRLDFPTNTYIEVPEQVAQVVSEANNQTMVALNQFKIGGDKGKENALQ